jgi:penicillin-binding protein 1A
MDFTLALGSSGVSLYEVTKAYSQLGRLGKRTRPVIIHKVEDQQGKVILEKVTLDERFQEQI